MPCHNFKKLRIPPVIIFKQGRKRLLNRPERIVETARSATTDTRHRKNQTRIAYSIEHRLYAFVQRIIVDDFGSPGLFGLSDQTVNRSLKQLWASVCDDVYPD